MIKYLFPLLCLIALIAACDLERDIDIKLPEYENEIALESYIEPGQPLRALIVESVSYTELLSTPIDENTIVNITVGGQQFPPIPLSEINEMTLTEVSEMLDIEVDEIVELFEGLVNFIERISLINHATVTINHNGQDYTLEQGIYFDFDNIKIYNYGHPYIVPADYTNDFSIQVTDTLNRSATASTKILPPVPIDSVVYFFNSQDTASIQAWFTDDAATENYYRFMVHGSNLIDNLYQDATINDRFFNGDDVPLGSGFEFGVGDTAIASLFHIDETYHDFYETYQEAFFANGNPFAQPAQILTNVEGGRGIFAALSYVRDTVIIE